MKSEPTDNPYEVSQSCQDPVQAGPTAPQLAWRLEGTSVVCQGGFVLPEVCIKTGAIHNLVRHQQVIDASSHLLLWSRRPVLCIYYLSVAERNRRRLYRFLGLAVWGCGFLACILLGLGHAPLRLVLCGGVAVVFLGGLILSFAEYPMKPYAATSEGWTSFKGIKPAFFRGLEQLRAAKESQ